MTTVIAVASVVIALASLALSYVGQRRASQVALVQTHLALRTRFLEIYRRLPLEGDELDEGRTALRAYWHNAYDEWFIANRLTPAFGRLWHEFYEGAIVSGLRHKPLEEELHALLLRPEGFSLYADEFVTELGRIVGRDLHPRSPQ